MGRVRALAFGFHALLLFAARAASAQLDPVGSEVRANVAIAGPQSAPSAAIAPSGRHAVVWQGPGTSTDVWLRAWNADGTQWIAETGVNTTLAGCQQNPVISFAPDGGFVVVWQSENDGSGWGVYARRFLATGAASGAEFRVNATTAGDQRAPAVAHAPSGSYVVTWESFGQDGSGWGVYARLFNNSGPLSGEVQVAASGTNDQRRPAVTVLPIGETVFAWEGPDLAGSGVFLRRFSSTLTTPGAEVRANPAIEGIQFWPAIATDASGNVIAAWEESSSTAGVSNIFARRFNRLLAPLTGAFAASSTAAGFQTRPKVGSSSGGDFVVAWESWAQDAGGPGIFARRFNFQAQAVGSDLKVNTFAGNTQNRPALAVSPGGSVLAAWESLGQDGDGAGAYLQRYALPGFDFYTVTPCRLFDTRDTTALQSGVERSFAVAGICGIPTTARAVSINAVALAGTGSGSIVLYPGDLSAPGTTNVNFGTNQIRSNNGMLSLASNGAGTIRARASVSGSPGQVHLILDVNGYFQ